jgi:hypothetical protein
MPVAWQRLLVAGLGGLLVVVTVSACGGGKSSPNYDAEATLKCLRHRPEFRREAPGPNGARPQSRGVTFTTVGPRRFNHYLPLYDVHGVSGYEFAVRWNPGHGYLGSFFDTGLIILDTVKEQRTMYHRLSNSSFLKADLKNTTIRRNVFISWGIAPVPKAPRSIVLGCLRTR